MSDLSAVVGTCDPATNPPACGTNSTAQSPFSPQPQPCVHLPHIARNPYLPRGGFLVVDVRRRSFPHTSGLYVLNFNLANFLNHLGAAVPTVKSGSLPVLRRSDILFKRGPKGLKSSERGDRRALSTIGLFVYEVSLHSDCVNRAGAVI